MLMVAALVLWNVRRLAVLTLPSGWGRSLAVILSSLLIFSPVQWENWLWGIQLICFVPIACLTGAIVACYTKLGAWTKLFISAALALVATYSFANGMICWVAMYGLVVVQFRTISERVKAAVAWAAFAGGSLSLYFHGYVWLPTTARLRDLPGFPAKAARCFLVFLGAPLGLGRGLEDVNLAMSVGAIVLLLVGLVIFELVHRRSEKEIFRQAGAWLTLAAYSLCSGIVTTIGRGRDTQVFLLDSRYTTFSLYTIVALMSLLLILYGKALLSKLAGSVIGAC
jgi:hypothetical protein